MNKTTLDIINFIKRGKISSTEVADSLDKNGAVQGLLPINKGKFEVGRISLVYGYNESNWDIHQQLENIREGDIVFVETHNCKNKAAFGELVSKFILYQKKAKAIIINGFLRDVNKIIKEDLPIWCKGVTPIGCFNRKNPLTLDNQIVKQWKEKYQDSIAICDDSGVVVIPKNRINDELIRKLRFIEIQEKIWFYCMEVKGWSTFDIVCRKKYLEKGMLTKELEILLKDNLIKLK